MKQKWMSLKEFKTINSVGPESTLLIMRAELKAEIDKMISNGKVTATKDELLDLFLKKALDWHSKGMIDAVESETER